ncbi:transcriptional enhancer factor TEF-5, partial [Paramuricea clavata]
MEEVKLVTNGRSENGGRERNIAMIYSEARNCGKSLSLQPFAYLQGATVPQPIIFAGGNETTSDITLNVMIRAVSSTTLVSLFDDPKMTASLSEYLYQIQGRRPVDATPPRPDFEIATAASRNEMISRHIKRCTGETRTAKQISNKMRSLRRKIIREIKIEMKDQDERTLAKTLARMESMTDSEVVFEFVVEKSSLSIDNDRYSSPHPDPLSALPGTQTEETITNEQQILQILTLGNQVKELLAECSDSKKQLIECRKNLSGARVYKGKNKRSQEPGRRSCNQKKYVNGGKDIVAEEP